MTTKNNDSKFNRHRHLTQSIEKEKKGFSKCKTMSEQNSSSATSEQTSHAAELKAGHAPASKIPLKFYAMLLNYVFEQ